MNFRQPVMNPYMEPPPHSQGVPTLNAEKFPHRQKEGTYHIEPVIRAVKGSPTACKYEFRRDPRFHSRLLISFQIYQNVKSVPRDWRHLDILQVERLILTYAETFVEGRYSEKRLAKVSEWWQQRHNPQRKSKRLAKVREVLQYRHNPVRKNI